MRHCRFWVAWLALSALSACTVGDADPRDDNQDDDQEDPADPPETPVIQSIASGQFAPMTGFETRVIAGRAQLVRTLAGHSIISVSVTGLAADVPHIAHVHAFPCEFAAGGHYKIDPVVTDPIEDNELWLNLPPAADGVGRAEVDSDHLARGDALSVVVHDPVTSMKMACADLALPAGESIAAGTFAPFAAAESVDATITGTASLTRTAAGSTLQLQLSGLTPAVIYASHVHALPCAVNTGGGHYKLDPTVTTTEEANEIWPTIGADEAGTTSDDLTIPHIARSDAQSLVVHRIVDVGVAPKVACADLVRDEYAELVTAGDSVLLDAGVSRFADLSASAEMTRTLGGSTRVTIDVSGLAASTEYTAHVHNLPCGVSDGGGHYALDTSIATVMEENEIWLAFTTDAAGAGAANVRALYTARADAQSIVIHDPADGARLACIDLD